MYLVGIAAGVAQGITPAFGVKKLTVGEYDYTVSVKGSLVTITRDVNFWNRQSAVNNVSECRERLAKVKRRLADVEYQLDGCVKALEASEIKLQTLREADKETEALVLESWRLMVNENQALYDDAKAVVDEAELKLLEALDVTFPDAQTLEVDLSSVKVV